MPAEYLFVDEWDVSAPIGAVFAALSDVETYPTWWTPTYLEARSDGPPGPGRVSQERFKARLPYTLSTTSRIVAWDPARRFEIEVTGDLRGHGAWSLSEREGGRVHVRFDWRVHADRALLRVLTPVLRPVFRWNHDQAIRRAMAGLEPYALRQRDEVAERLPAQRA